MTTPPKLYPQRDTDLPFVKSLLLKNMPNKLPVTLA